ncbi:MAG: trigger factor [Candidatus Abyssubacteria bacterium]
MKVTVEKPTSYQRVLTIEVPFEKVGEEIETIYSRLQKTATHPGFRTGKVPRKLLEKKYGESVRNEAIEVTVASTLRNVLEEEKLTPLTDPEFGEVNFEDAGPLQFKATIEVEPEVELCEYKGIELRRPKLEVTDEDVNRVLERLRLSHSKYLPADRPVEKGDIVIIDFESFRDGVPVEGGKAENFPLEVGSQAFGEDFENQLVGMAKDEKRRIKVTYPDDYRDAELAGKEIEFDVTVKDVKLRELPQLDDDFAKELGQFETLEELKKHTRENLQKDLERRLDHFVREQALSKLTNESKVEIPPKLKSRVAASIFEDEIRNLAYQGVKKETITEQRDKIVEFADAEAARQLRALFVTDEIARRENISVSDDELKQSIENTIKDSDDPRMRDYLNSERVRERYRQQLLRNKILDFVIENAKIIEVEKADFERSAEAAQEHQKQEEGER